MNLCRQRRRVLHDGALIGTSLPSQGDRPRVGLVRPVRHGGPSHAEGQPAQDRRGEGEKDQAILDPNFGYSLGLPVADDWRRVHKCLGVFFIWASFSSFLSLQKLTVNHGLYFFLYKTVFEPNASGMGSKCSAT